MTKPPHQQVRKFRTLTELIMDAEEHVKNPYKGKKLKVRCGVHPPPHSPQQGVPALARLGLSLCQRVPRQLCG